MLTLPKRTSPGLGTRLKSSTRGKVPCAAFTSSRLLMESGQRQTSWTKIGTQFLSKSRSACGKFPVIAKPLAGTLVLPILASGLAQESG